MAKKHTYIQLQLKFQAELGIMEQLLDFSFFQANK